MDDDLPEGWNKNYSTSQQRHYWFNTTTKTSQWHAPTASDAADPEKAKRFVEDKVRLEKSRIQSQSNGDGSGSESKKRSADASSSSSSSSSSQRIKLNDSNNGNSSSSSSSSSKPQVRVAIIVPFRDLHVEQNRSVHLSRFLPHMCAFLSSNPAISFYQIFIVEQSDDGRKFNRGKLLNVGFDLACKPPYDDNKNEFDIFIFHDVDLLPGPDLSIHYSTLPSTPIHIARCWSRYSSNAKYFGGIVSFSKRDMLRINGYPNTFWGWGGEDDEMQLRVERNDIKWTGVEQGTMVDLEDMQLDEKLTVLRDKREWKCMVKWEVLKEHEATWSANGLANIDYQVISNVNVKQGEGEGGNENTNTHVSRVLVDVKLNGGHWSDFKCGVDYLGG